MTYALFAIGILMSALGSLCLKIGGNALPHFSPTLQYGVSLISNKYVLLGFVLYFVPALLWVYLLGKYPLSYVQPIIALTYALTPVLAFFFLKEPIPTIRWLGIVVIVIGVGIVSRSH